MTEKILFEYLFCIIDIILLVKFCDTVFKRKFKNFLITSSSVLIFSSFLFFTSFIFSFLSSITVYLFFIMYAILFYDGTLLSRITNTSIYYILYGILTLLLLSTVSTIFSIDMSKFIEEIYLLRILFTIFSRLIVYVLLIVLAKKIKKEMNNKYFHQTTIGIFLTSCAILLIFLYDLILNSKAHFNSIEIFALVVSVIMMVLCLFQINKSYLNLKLENNQIKFALEANNLQQQAYLERAKNDVEIMLIRHDLKNMLLTMNYLLDEGKTDEVKKMIKQVSSNEVLTKKINSNNEVLNALLNIKIREHPEINFITNINIDKLKINSIDLSSLLGNSLDNAIDAVSSIIEGNKEIYIDIKEEYNIIYFMIKNTYNKKPIKQGGKFLTSKSDKKNHGLGILSMKKIAKNYDGEVNITVDEKYFKLEIYLFLS